MRKAIALGILLGLIVAVFVWGAERQSRLVNTDMSTTDQGAYLNYAKSMAQTNLRYVGGRNRMPVYPALMSFFFREGMSDEEFFAFGKNVGIVIGLSVVVVAFLVFRRVSKPVDALVGTLVATFTVFAYKSPYFQTEVLFYGITLVWFYLLLSLIRKPAVLTAALAGLVGGIAYLAKASVLPALLLAGALVVVRTLLDSWRRHQAGDAASLARGYPPVVLKDASTAIVLFGCFLLVVFPYIRTSKERFGHYFYNVNTTFYIWYDSWEEAKQGTRAHGDRQGWPDMPAEQIPSMQKYIREHSAADILGRFARGFRNMGREVASSYGYAEFVVVYVIALLLLVVQNAGTFRSLLRRTHPCVLLFVLGYFLGHILLYAWYVPIASGNRFILSLFLPAMLVILWLLSFGQDHLLDFGFLRTRIPAAAVSPAILLFLISYMLVVFPSRVSTMYGGH